MAWVYPENDTSAFKRRRVRLPDGSTALRVDRPEFRRMLADLASGAIGAVIAYDLDRVARDPRDLEDLIDLVEARRIPTAAVTGSLDLSNDSGITVARISVAIANKSSRDTARRVARKHLELAEQGKFGGGGIRPYGYEADGVTVRESEAVIIREIRDRLLAGDSLSGIARDLTRRAVPTVQGRARWAERSVHSLITKARIAGLREHKGEVVGPAAWPAIISKDEWLSVLSALHRRAEGSGNELKHWLSGVLRCGRCNRALRGQFVSAAKHRYWCEPKRGGCGRLGVQGVLAEDFVERIILAYVERPDVAASIARATAGTSVDHLRKEAAEDEAQLKDLARMWGARQLSTPEYLAARKPIQERIDRTSGLLLVATPTSLRRLLANTDKRSAWRDMDPRSRQDTARSLFPSGVMVKPAERRGAGFDAARFVFPDWPAGPGDRLTGSSAFER